MTRPSDSPPIQSLHRGLLLLEAVARAGRPVALAELTPLLGIDRSSVSRLASTLRQHGFLTQLPDSKQYVLGSAIWQLAGSFRFRDMLVLVAREHVGTLAAHTGETTHLALREGRQAVLVDHQITAHPLGVAAGSGFSVPLHCTSVGKALLADFDLPQLAALYGDEPLVRLTGRTIATLEALAEDCRRTRERGFALDDEEHHDAVRCIAVPIRDAAGQVVASIGISAPADRLPRDRFRAVGEDVARSAAAISRRLGYSD